MSTRVQSLKIRLASFFYSIRFRLVLWFVLILGVVLSVFSVFIYTRQSQETQSIAFARLSYKIERFIGSSRLAENPSILGALPGGTPGADPWNSWFQEGDILALVSSDGTVQQAWGSLEVDQVRKLPLLPAGWDGFKLITLNRLITSGSPAIPGRPGYLFASLSVIQGDQVYGYVLLGTPVDPDRQLGRLVASLSLGSILTLIIALSGGFLLADRAMRPVQTITQTARSISETDLSLRLNIRGKNELAELANTFDEMLARLQIAFERQRQFTADASHELRTPLTIVELEASRVLTTRRSAQEYERALKVIQSENQFMIRMVNNLLALARMDAGQVVLHLEDLDLGDVTLEAIERLAPLAASKGVSLIVNDFPKVIVRGDCQYLGQMLANLLENAIKYSADFGACVTVEMGTRQDDTGNQAWVRVSDNGPGIAPEHIPHLFDRFYQVDPSRSRPETGEGSQEPASSGTGLGLSIALWIAQAHHGNIAVQSELGKGSIFEVILPTVQSLIN